MKTAYTSPSATFAALSSAWLSACAQPWTAWQGWSQLMGSQWQQWLNAVGSVPNVWLPALASDRRGQSQAIDFFLPWLPRGEGNVMPLDVHGAETAVRLMMRAALPLFGGVEGKAGEIERESGPARVLDLVSRTSNVSDAEGVSPKAAVSAVAPKAAPPRTTRAKPTAPGAAQKPAAAAKTTAAKTTAAKTTAAKTSAAKTSAAKTTAAKTTAAKTTAAKTTAAKTTAAKPAVAKPVQAPVAVGTAGEVQAKPAPRRVRRPATPPAEKA
ncbi:MAG: hypothetical protein RBT39_03940 [Azoarcus sp.]|jgi:hypothetical protein|nr:hypothetical protein [Azoarcus sp.]